MSDSIINYTAKETRRADIEAGVSYDDDVDRVWLLSQSSYWIALEEEQGAERTSPLSADV